MSKKKLLLLVSAVLSLSALVACDADLTETISTDESAVVATGQAAPVPFFTVRPDLRRCAAPLCGGFWVKRVNAADTICFDGSQADECYVPALSFTALHLDPAERQALEARVHAGLAVVRGVFASKSYRGIGELGVLRVTEAWDAASEQAPTGTIFAVAATGIQCIAAPCPTLHATALNDAARDTQITDLDLAAVSTDDVSKDEAVNAAYADVLLVAGAIESCDRNVTLHASQLFTKVAHQRNVVGQWRANDADRGRTTYDFAADGTFSAVHEPGCVFAKPACMVKLAPATGTWKLAGRALHLEYTSAVRPGDSADFRLVGTGKSTRLEGQDFGLALRLALL
jgi:hypothetical protein